MQLTLFVNWLFLLIATTHLCRVHSSSKRASRRTKATHCRVHRTSTRAAMWTATTGSTAPAAPRPTRARAATPLTTTATLSSPIPCSSTTHRRWSSPRPPTPIWPRHPCSHSSRPTHQVSRKPCPVFCVLNEVFIQMNWLALQQQ